MTGQLRLLRALADEASGEPDPNIALPLARAICGWPVPPTLFEDYTHLRLLRDRVDSDLCCPECVIGPHTVSHDEARWEALDTLDGEIVEFEARLCRSDDRPRLWAVQLRHRMAAELVAEQITWHVAAERSAA